MKNKNTYKINDLVQALDRDKTTILRWEKQGLIPSAKRDSRGWRYYSGEDFENIIRKVKENHYFNHRLVTMLVTLALAINIIGFFAISRFAMGTNANVNANLNVTAGSLTVSASTTQMTTFSDKAYSFTAGTSTTASPATAYAVGVSDTRGGSGNWTLNLSCKSGAADCMWRGVTEMDRFAAHQGAAAGTSASTSGIFCINFTNWRCVSAGGESCSGTVTASTGYKCFSSGKTDVTLAIGASAHGEFWFAESNWDQSVPGYTTASVYTTILMYDLN